MSSRLQDLLVLVSRVQDKRGDIRFMVRQDPTVQQEIHAYLDDLQWLTQVRTPAPSRGNTAAGKQELIARLRRSGGRHQLVPARILGLALSLSLLAAIIASNQQAAARLPEPVDQALDGFFRRDDQVQASPFDLSTPAKASLDAAGPGVTN